MTIERREEERDDVDLGDRDVGLGPPPSLPRGLAANEDEDGDEAKKRWARPRRDDVLVLLLMLLLLLLL